MEISIESFEGDIYLAFQRRGNNHQIITDANNDPVRFTSLDQAHEYFRGKGEITAWLVQRSAYDEMIGEQCKSGQWDRIPLHW